jgi:hypothetical protein
MNQTEFTGAVADLLLPTDLDARFRVNPACALDRTIKCSYIVLATQTNLIALRAQGCMSVMSYLDLVLEDVPVPAGSKLELRYSMRVGLRSRSPSQPPALVQEMNFGLFAPLGAAVLTRPSEVVDATPRQVASARLVASTIRPFATGADRVVSDMPDVLGGIEIHQLGKAFPLPADLLEVDGVDVTREASGANGRGRIWGFHETDANGVVSTFAIAARALDTLTECLDTAEIDVSTKAASRIQILYRAPFRAGERFTARAQALKAPAAAATGLLQIVPAAQPSGRASTVARVDYRDVAAPAPG